MVNLLEEFLTRARISLTDMKCQDFSRCLIQYIPRPMFLLHSLIHKRPKRINLNFIVMTLKIRLFYLLGVSSDLIYHRTGGKVQYVTDIADSGGAKRHIDDLVFSFGIGAMVSICILKLFVEIHTATGLLPIGLPAVFFVPLQWGQIT